MLSHLMPEKLAALGYTNLSLISETDDFYIYHAFTREGRAVLVKLPASAMPSEQLAHELEAYVLSVPTETIQSDPQQLDALLLAKATQALSGELELPGLIEALMTSALESTGADKGLLILPRGHGFEVEAEANAKGAEIDIRIIRTTVKEPRFPETIINTVINTRQRVTIEDTSSALHKDLYLQQGAARSLFCLPLLRLDGLAGILYLENSQTTYAFNSARIALLEALAAQAAILLESARLYRDLRKSEAKYQHMLEMANEGIWIQDDNFRTTFANEHMAAMLGYSAAELMAHEVKEFLFEEDVADHAHKMKERTQNISDVYERRMRHKDGSTIWMSISATPLFEEGSFHGSFAILTDITERKKAEQNLVASEQLFRTLVENSTDNISRYDLDLRRIYINPMLEKKFKVPIDKALGKTSKTMSPLINPDSYMDNLRKVIATGQEISDEIAYRALSGETHWASARFAPEFDRDGKVSSILVISNETTERKMAELQLTNAKQMYQTLVDNLPDCVARFDTEGHHLFVNSTVEKTFGVNRDSFLNQTLTEIDKVGANEQNIALVQSVRRVAMRGEPEIVEVQWETVKGRRDFKVRNIPERDKEGRISSVLGIAHDITEAKQAEEKNREYLHFLQSLDRVNQLLHEEGDLEQIMNRALQEALDIFGVDRTYLAYPCDPDAETWSVSMESARAEYPGVMQQGAQPVDGTISSLFQALTQTNRPIAMGPGGQYPMPAEKTAAFSTQSDLIMILRPRIDKPWLFGIQQCSHGRIWTDREIRLFEEVSHRLSDALNNLLITRNLRESEARFRLVFENSPVSIQEEDYAAVKSYLEALRPEFGDDLETYLKQHPKVVEDCAALVRFTDVNQAALTLHEADNKMLIQQGLPKIFLPESLPVFRKILVSLMEGETNFRLEIALQTLTGHRHHIDAFFSVSPGYEQNLGKILVSLIDISELKQAEQERQEHLSFLESLDRINLVLQAEGDIEQILGRTLDEVLDIFDCDRAYLQYPCDPDATEWWVPIERCKPDYPTVLIPGEPLPDLPDFLEILRTLLDSDSPIRAGEGMDRAIPTEVTEQLGVRSLMAVSLHPKEDRPWQFGIHQCSHNRIWSDQEARLLEEIGHRLSDALNDLLITRNLRESEERFRLVFENSPVPTWEEDFSASKARLDELQQIHGSDLEAYLTDHPEIVKECAALVRIININSAVLELHQATSKEELYEGLPKTFVPESYDAFRKELVALSRGETELFLDSSVQTLNGDRREVSVSFSVCPGYEQSLSKVFVSLFDITQRKQNEERLRLAASVFSTSQEGILISDLHNRIIDVNPAFTRLTGYSREEALGQNPGFLSAGQQGREFYDEMWQSINTQGEWQGELWNQRKSGEVFPELLSIVAVKDAKGQLQHYVGAFSDISTLKRHEADLDRIAHYDMLTSVPNRRLLDYRMEQAIAYADRHSKSLAVCYLDLDGFKPINDQFGHDGGDQILIETARRLETMSRGEDTVSRLGGDEFVLLWNDIDAEADCIKALERILKKVSEPIVLNDTPVSVSVSIGVTLYPDDNVDADSLLRHADHAMYTAKQLGKNRYKMFDARLERQISAQAELLTKVAQGLDRKQFELYYQPKVDFTTGAVVSVEALLRWNDPVLGLVGPKEFLALIENDNLAFRMGRWVMAEAICQAKKWQKSGITLPISINIFPRHLKHRSFVDDLREMIASHWPKLPKHRLLMEIVETVDLEELEPIEQVIKECVAMGVGFSLDDFGTGYSSLVYLRRLSIEELKIDQSFIRDMLEDPDDEAIVTGVVRLGQAFGLRVVAEGVESIQQARHLVDLGCTIVQGFGFGHPMSASAFQKWYANFEKVRL